MLARRFGHARVKDYTMPDPAASWFVSRTGPAYRRPWPLSLDAASCHVLTLMQKSGGARWRQSRIWWSQYLSSDCRRRELRDHVIHVALFQYRCVLGLAKELGHRVLKSLLVLVILRQSAGLQTYAGHKLEYATLRLIKQIRHLVQTPDHLLIFANSTGHACCKRIT